MIQQVLQRAPVLRELLRVRDELVHSPQNLGREGPARLFPEIPGENLELTAEDITRAANELAAAQTRDASVSSGQSGYEAFTDRRGDTAPLLDDSAFFSHERAISLLQSALEGYHLEEKPGAVGPSLRRGAGQWEPVAARRLLNSFSETDPAWVASVVAMGLKLFYRPHPFGYKPADAKLDARARVIVVGDWGSGIERARGIAGLMHDRLEDARKVGRETHIIHLGDVYYSGWGWECDRRFLQDWPVDPDEIGETASWALNGNHDMYSGGYGFFDHVLCDGRFSRQERTSYFRLSNEHWQLLGLDSAYKENTFFDPQSDWVRQHADAAAGTGQKTMLLSHHQPFSVYEKGGLKLDDKFRGVLAAGRVRAWLFGHEHRCVIYDEQMGVKYPRLLGHGGVPVYMGHRKDDPFVSPVAYEYRNYLPGGINGIEHWAPFGFAVLDFDGPRIQVRYHYEDGAEYPTRDQPPEVME
jgi:hypothetical protein